jgi:hypothetical protein
MIENKIFKDSPLNNVTNTHMIFDLGFLEKIIIIEKERSHNK